MDRRRRRVFSYVGVCQWDVGFIFQTVIQYRAIWSLCLGLSTVVVMLSGCGHGNPLNRQAVSGNVSFDGTALDQGTIELSPRQQQGGVSSGARVWEGSYAIPTEQGLPPGKYLVRIFSAEKRDAPSSVGKPPGPGNPPGKERIPAQYNSQSQILVEVTADGHNKFDFDIRTRN